MRLAGLEWKKLMRTPVVWIAAAALAALNVFLFVTMDNIYFAPASADGIAHIQQEKEQGAYFKGAVTEDWISRYRAEVEAIRENPDNQLKGRDREEKMQQLLAQGYDRDYIEENLQLEFLKPEVLQSEEYERYESVEWAGLFYEQAAKCGAQYAAYYGEQFNGKKEAVLIASVKEKYRKLAEEYTACYNYALGYGRMDGILLTYKTTLGMLILIGLIGIFSGEYVRKTDALILCAKYGREKLGAAKIKAGLCFAAAAWLGMTALNLGLTTYFYGWEGWEAFWQDWIYVTAPYQWNQGTAMAFGLGTSLLGALYWAAVVMLLSALVKRAVPAVFCGLAVLLLPSMVMENVAGYLIRRICWLFPSVILGGGQIWCSYDGIYAFGKVLDYQLVVLCLAAAFSVVSGACAVGAFRRHQVRN